MRSGSVLLPILSKVFLPITMTVLGVSVVTCLKWARSSGTFHGIELLVDVPMAPFLS